MKLKNNKKASENWVPDTMPFFILYCIAIGALVLSFFVITLLFISKVGQLRGNVEETIIIERFYSSAECFAYQDAGSNRVYQKTIDWDKFTSRNTIPSGCIPLNNLRYAFKLELNNPETSSGFVAKTPNWVEGSNFRMVRKNIFIHGQEGIKNELLIHIQNV